MPSYKALTNLFNHVALGTCLFTVSSLPCVTLATGLGGTISIPTSQSLSSSTVYSNLPTPDTVSVTLNQQSYVTVMYNSSVIKTGCLGTMLSILSIDNVQQPGTEALQGINVNSSGANNINYTLQLPAGVHNFSVLHRVDGCAGVWFNRSLTVLIHT